MALFGIREVADFFDGHASRWDAGMIRNEDVIAAILDYAGIDQGSDVLDVGCGTGVLIPDYLSRKVNSVTAVDVSPKMAEIAAQKFFALDDVTVLCRDVFEMEAERRWDAVMVYNAFPHFPDPEALIRHLSVMLRPGGTLTVAHGMGREAINRHHDGCARRVSVGLPEAEALSKLFGKYLQVETVLSDEKMYLVTGRKCRKAEEDAR